MSIAGNEPRLTHRRLVSLLSYDQESGAFTRKVKVSNALAFSMAGYIKNNGYREVRIDGMRFHEHRLAWFYVYRQWPTNDIDHIDGNPMNNSIANLRDVPHVDNMANQKMSAANSTGHTGVYFEKRYGTWCAKIKRNYREIYIGTFKRKEEAAAAYTAKKAELLREPRK